MCNACTYLRRVSRTYILVGGGVLFQSLPLAKDSIVRNSSLVIALNEESEEKIPFRNQFLLFDCHDRNCSKRYT